MKLKLLIIFSICLTAFAHVYSQEVIDKIVAHVDNEIICQSELDFQTQMFATQKSMDPNTPGLKEQILNSLVEEKLAYAQANFDSLFVTDEEVNQRINYQMDNFIQQLGSKEAVEKAYGMSFEKIKKELRQNVTKTLMVQKLQEKNFGQVTASRREVEEFYNTYKDSIPTIPEKFEISHIFMLPKISENLKAKYKQQALALLDSIKNGAKFEDIAKKYSEDPASAVKGGNLGFAKRGSFFPQFEAAAYELKDGQISGVVESPVGYHIIQMIEKRGDNINTRHILIRFKNDDEADLRVIESLNEIRDTVVRKLNSFANMAKLYSEDKETANFGGVLGEFYANQLDKSLTDIVYKMDEGEISFPKRLDYGKAIYGYHIVYLKKRIAQHKADVSTDYTEVERLAVNKKKSDLYQKWISELKKKIYWEIKL